MIARPIFWTVLGCLMVNGEATIQNTTTTAIHTAYSATPA
jgi:hypothetical protein